MAWIAENRQELTTAAMEKNLSKFLNVAKKQPDYVSGCYEILLK